MAKTFRQSRRWNPRIVAFFFVLSSLVVAVAPAQVSATTVPSAPSISSVVAGQGQLTITFAVPVVGSASVSGYRAEYSTNGSSWTLASDTISSAATSYAITGLNSETTYYVRVAAKYSDGIGAWGYNWQQVYAVTNPSRRTSGGVNQHHGKHRVPIGVRHGWL